MSKGATNKRPAPGCKQMELVCRARGKKNRSCKGEVGRIAPNLLNRDFHTERLHQK